MTTQTTALATTRVSFREVKEESYRALRAGGYPWGVAQMAGRLAGVAQVVWGTGVGSVTSDAKRWMGGKRLVTSHRMGSDVVVNSRGSSWLLSGPVAVTAALTTPGRVVWVKGEPLGPELAAVMWDMVTPPNVGLTWGAYSAGQWRVHHLTAQGDLLVSDASQPPGKPPGKSAKNFVTQSAAESGDVVFRAEDRTQLLTEALSLGVAVAAPTWEQLMTHSRKFLVPE